MQAPFLCHVRPALLLVAWLMAGNLHADAYDPRMLVFHWVVKGAPNALGVRTPADASGNVDADAIIQHMCTSTWWGMARNAPGSWTPKVRAHAAHGCLPLGG